MNIHRFFRSLSRTVAIIVSIFVPFVAQAAEIETGNVQTGAFSENTNEVQVNRDVRINVEQSADVTRNIDLSLTTGGNTVANNTVVEDVSTGDVTASIETSTEANTGTLGVGGLSLQSDGDVSIESVNRLTGFNSSNENNTTIDSSVDIAVSNQADIDESFVIDANTGDNNIVDNTFVGDVETGDINIEIVSDIRANVGATVGVPPSEPGGEGPVGGGEVTPPPVAPGAEVTPPSVPSVPTIPGLPSIPSVVTAMLPERFNLPMGVGGAFFPAGASGYAILGLLALLSGLIAGLPNLKKYIVRRVA